MRGVFRGLRHRPKLPFVVFVSFVVNTSALCEIRVLTYRRPEMLRRALRSVIDQTHQDWVARIFDDSPDREGEGVVRDLGDRRLDYRPNPRRLGAAKNTDQAFSTGPLVGGRYACVLEDDNWYLPTFLEDNIRLLAEKGCPILLRNQRIDREASAGSEPTGRTTRGQLLDEGILDPARLHALVLVSEGISNGGLFWQTDARSELQVGPWVEDAYLQEHCRTLQIREPVYFAAEPLAIWSEMGPASATRRPCDNRLLSRGRQGLHREVTARHGARILPWIEVVAARAGYTRKLQENLAYAGLRRPGMTLARYVKCRVKSALRALVTRDPTRDYLAALNGRAPWDVERMAVGS